MKFIFKVFTEINGYPENLVKSMFQKVKEKQEVTHEESTNSDATVESETEDTRTLTLKVPFRGELGETLIKRLKKTLQRNLMGF